MKIQYKYALLLAWMVVIFLLSNEVASTSSARSAVIVGFLESTHISLSAEILTFLTRKAAHICAYFILGILLFNVVRTHKIDTKRAVLLSVALACAYAGLDEFHQLFVPGRSGELRDVLIDTTAASVGVTVYYFVHKMRQTFSVR